MMENPDQKLAQRVWQRVHSQEPGRPGLPALAAAERHEAAVYLMLSRLLQGREKTLLRQIFTQEQEHAACLRGMHYLITDQPLSVRTTPAPSDSPELALRKSYGRKRKALQEYKYRTDDPEYGAVFAELARQEQEHCRLILEVLGRLR